MQFLTCLAAKLGGHTFFGPAYLAIAERLALALFLGCVSQTKPISIYKDNVVQKPFIINAWLAAGSEEKGLKTRHL